MKLIIIALAPVLIISLFIYTRDKYEKEPIGMIIKALVLGCVSPIPIILLEGFLSDIKPAMAWNYSAFYDAFVVVQHSKEVQDWIITLYNRDIRDKKDFEERSSYFFTGRKID